MPKTMAIGHWSLVIGHVINQDYGQDYGTKTPHRLSDSSQVVIRCELVRN